MALEEVNSLGKNEFVARFIGSPPMNLIPQRRGGQEVLLGVRPEHLDPRASENLIESTITFVESLGSESTSATGTCSWSPAARTGRWSPSSASPSWCCMPGCGRGTPPTAAGRWSF